MSPVITAFTVLATDCDNYDNIGVADFSIVCEIDGDMLVEWDELLKVHHE